MRGEKGFTLIEVLVVVGILGAIMGVMAMTVMTIMIVSPKSNDHVIALRQVQNAGYWISRDTQMAQNIHTNLTAPEFLILTWTDWDLSGGGNIYHSVTYTLEDMPDGVKKLMRRHQDSEGEDEQILIAEYIYYDPGGDPDNSTKIIDYQNPTLTVRMTATSGEVTVIREYEASSSGTHPNTEPNRG